MSINSTLFFQMLVFAILCIFTVKVVWPPIVKALDERAKKVADSLAAADQAKAEVQDMNAKVEEQLAAMRSEAATQRADAERRAQEIVDEAKTKANGDIEQGVYSARVQVQSESVATVKFDGYTDRQGEWLLPNVPAGAYRVKVTAAGSKSARLTTR